MYPHSAPPDQYAEWEGVRTLFASVPPDQQAEWSTEPDYLAHVRLARQIARSEHASLLLPGGDGPTLALVAASGMADDIVTGAPARLVEAVARFVAHRHRPLLVNDAGDLEAALGPGAADLWGMPLISVPVPLDGAVRGVLNIAAPTARAAYRASDLEGLQHLAGLIGTNEGRRTTHPQRQPLEVVIARRQDELIRVQEGERQRLARELHDEAGHALTIALLRVDLERVKPATPGPTRQALTQARDAIMEAATALNDMAFRLRPRILEDLGLLPALRTLVTQTQLSGALRVTLDSDGEVPALHDDVELAAFRVVQEALTNTRKHAEAHTASVHLDFLASGIVIVIEDDGIGIDSRETPIAGPGSQGLPGMRERVEVLGGTLAIGPRREGGTRVVAALPLRPRGTGDGQR